MSRTLAGLIVAGASVSAVAVANTTTSASASMCRSVPTEALAPSFDDAAHLKLREWGDRGQGFECRWTDGASVVSYSVSIPQVNTPAMILGVECPGSASSTGSWLTSDACLEIVGSDKDVDVDADAPWDPTRPAHAAYYVESQPCPSEHLPAATCPYNSVIVRASIVRSTATTTADQVLELAVSLDLYL